MTPRLHEVDVGAIDAARLEPLIGAGRMAQFERTAEASRDALAGNSVLNVNSTAAGGGVAEMLQTLLAYARGAGVDARWLVIEGDPAFFAITKRIHNGLYGFPGDGGDLGEAERTHYEGVLQRNVDELLAFVRPGDVVVIHDPQPAGLIKSKGDRGKWIWRCHIDLTAANETYWSFLRPYVQAYDAAIFTMPEYVKKDLQIGKVAIVPPAIDPLSPKNAPMSDEDAARVVSLYGIDPTRPMLVQVSRFDPWKDPLGVIDVYRAVRQRFPEVQLVLVGSMAHDDPEGMEYYQRTKDYAEGDTDIHLLSNIDGVGNVEVNAIQRMATVVLQKSLREGFGLTISEGLWKGKPVIGGNVGGIPLQIQDGETGYLVTSIEECSKRTLELMRNPVRAQKMGERGREVVRQNFLSTANLRNYLRLFSDLTQTRSAARPRHARSAV